MLNIKKTQNGDELKIMLEGRLDTTTAPQLEASLKDALPEAASLVFDLSALEYISSAGLRVLLTAHKLMSKKRGMTLCHVSEALMEIFDVTGFSDILNIQ